MRTVVNDYGTLLEPWKARLIVDRARRLGVPRDELEDIQQELVQDIAAVEFDPTRADSRATPLMARIDNRVISYLRQRSCYEGHVANLRPVESYGESVALRLDVRQTVAMLPEREQAVCEGLSQGHTVAAIARRIGCGRSTVVRLVVRIRLEFQQRGIDQWLVQ